MSTTPHRCPVCEGHGWLPYPDGVAVGMPFLSTSTGPWPCRVCKGVGVLWSESKPEPSESLRAQILEE